MAIVTVSRQSGSGGDGIARKVCEVLGYSYFDKALMTRVAQEQGISEAEMVDFSEDTYRVRSFVDALLRRPAAVGTATVAVPDPRGGETRTTVVVNEAMAAEMMTSIIRALQKRGRVVIVGRGGQAILRDDPGSLHVRIVARLEDRVQRLMQEEGFTRERALSAMHERDRLTAEYLQRFHAIEWTDPTLYHLTINASSMVEEEAAEAIATAARWLDAQRLLTSRS